MDHNAYGTKCETFEDFTLVKFQIVSCNILYCSSGYMSHTRRPQSRVHLLSRIFGVKIFHYHQTITQTCRVPALVNSFWEGWEIPDSCNYF